MIHVNRGGTSLGLFPEEEVREGLRTGRFAPSDFGWRVWMTNWQPLSQFPELGPPAAESSGPPPPLPPLPRSAHETTPAAQSGTPPVGGGGRIIEIARNYLLPRGRLGRAQFIVRSALIWIGWGVLISVLVSPLSFGLTSKETVIAGVTVSVTVVGWILAALLFFWVMSMQAAKRLHDFNRSGGWVFVGLLVAAWAGRLAKTPTGGHANDADLALGVLGFLGLLIFGLILCLVPGNKGVNRFGVPPLTNKSTRVAAVVCACFVAFVLSLLLLAFIGGFINGIKSTRQERSPERHSDVRSAQVDASRRKTEREPETALRSLQAFGASLQEWAKRPNCGQDKECVTKEFALLDRLARDADDYLGQSPVLWADLQRTKAAKALSEEDVAKQTAIFQKFDNAAVMVREFAKALNEFKNSRTMQDMEERRKATVVARVKLDQALKDFQLLPQE
jgi:uncharacterized membrane protein YhaH (DUF805 family)